MLTLSSQYALKAVIYLIRASINGPISGPTIARGTGIPSKYLSTIMSELVRIGILESTRGKRGGFWLSRSPKKISLHDVVASFEPGIHAKRRCPFGNELCSDKDPCLAHEEWKQVLETEVKFLKHKTVQDIALGGKRIRGRSPAKGATS